VIVDVLAGIAMVGGALLTFFGAVGLLRFPDVFARMHSATKATTVGVIGITAAAAAEVGALGGSLILMLVVALLFLSAPLGMSLLARAAYHDPETPGLVKTREIVPEPPAAESTSARRVGGTSPFLALWLWLAWIAAFGSVTPGVLIGGAIVAGIVAYALRVLAPRWPEALLHPGAALRFAGYFAWQVVVATWQVVKALFRPVGDLKPAIVIVPLQVGSRNEATLLMNAISFTPGTVALELHGNRLSVHVLDTDDPREVVAEIARMESMITAAFGGSRHSQPAAGSR
jgi:monovalent cation/proton antiporter MnhG/PhaG subunit